MKPFSVQARRMCRCPKCGANPWRDCRDPSGELLPGCEVHDKRILRLLELYPEVIEEENRKHSKPKFK